MIYLFFELLFGRNQKAVAWIFVNYTKLRGNIQDFSIQDLVNHSKLNEYPGNHQTVFLGSLDLFFRYFFFNENPIN